MPEPDGVRAEIADLDRRITEITDQIGELTGETGGQDEGPLEPEERAALLTNTEELQGVLEALRQRRETLQAQLDGS